MGGERGGVGRHEKHTQCAPTFPTESIIQSHGTNGNKTTRQQHCGEAVRGDPTRGHRLWWKTALPPHTTPHVATTLQHSPGAPGRQQQAPSCTGMHFAGYSTVQVAGQRRHSPAGRGPSGARGAWGTPLHTPGQQNSNHLCGFGVQYPQVCRYAYLASLAGPFPSPPHLPWWCLFISM